MYLHEKNLYINEDSNILFDLNSYRIYCITDKVLQYLQGNGLNDSETLNENETEIIQQISAKEMEILSESISYKAVKIHVSNTCNLRCKYCYAQGGNYGSEDYLMDLEIIKKTLDFIDKREEFNNLEYITFFGGEPLMAYEAIEYICKHTKERNVRYLLQTNGTIINTEIIRILKEHEIILTFSLDGPKQMNDFNRIDKNGNGTFEKILKNIQILKDNGIPVKSIEATLSDDFIEKYSKAEIADFIYRTTGIQRIKVEYDLLSNKALEVSTLEEEVELFFDRTLSGKYIIDNDAFKILSTFFSREYNDFICPAGNRTISIDVHGNIFPCQLFLEDKLWNMGSVEDTFSKELTHSYQKSKKKECRSCFAKSTCNVCIVSGLKNKFCDRNRANLKLVLDRLARCIKEEKFTDFYTNFSSL